MTAERLYAALLYLYSKGFREEYGDEMRAAFRAVHASGRHSPARFWMFVVSDVFSSAARERLDGARWLATSLFGLFVTVAMAQGVTFVYSYFYHPYFEGTPIPPLLYGAALGLVLGMSVAAAQWVLFPVAERRAARWALASAVALPVAILFCSSALEQALDGLNPVVQIHHPIALDLFVIGLAGPANRLEFATQFAAMTASALIVRALTLTPITRRHAH